MQMREVLQIAREKLADLHGIETERDDSGSNEPTHEAIAYCACATAQSYRGIKALLHAWETVL